MSNLGRDFDCQNDEPNFDPRIERELGCYEDTDGGEKSSVIFDKQIFYDLIVSYEDKINERGTFTEIASKNGSSLFFFSIDIEFKNEGIWDLIGILDVEPIFTISRSDETSITDYMEGLFDELESELEGIGLDTQKIGDYKVRVGT